MTRNRALGIYAALIAITAVVVSVNGFATIADSATTTTGQITAMALIAVPTLPLLLPNTMRWWQRILIFTAAWSWIVISSEGFHYICYYGETCTREDIRNYAATHPLYELWAPTVSNIASLAATIRLLYYVPGWLRHYADKRYANETPAETDEEG